VDDLLERHHPRALRAFLLRHHYRQDWSFEEGPAPEVGRLDAGSLPRPGLSSDAAAADLRRTFFEALDQDLNTPLAMHVLDLAAKSSEPDAKALQEEGTALLGLDL
jgi:L-cysteine:1D-myo-inositol 2-amino-2-deoxy-alpha-D-glucopyranoside ligase